MLNQRDYPVIVVGQATTSLSVQRLVSKLGHPVYAACPAHSWAASTRYYRPLPTTEVGRWCGELGSAGNAHLRALPFEHAIVIPTADDAALWLSTLPSDLCDRYLVCGSDRESLDMLQDKGKFAVLTAELGIARPQSFLVSTKNELLNLPIDWSATFFFKPRDSQAFDRRYGVKALRFSSKNAALHIWDRYEFGSIGILVQEYVPGGANQHYFIDGFRDSSGAIRARTARRRIRMYPSDFGNSSLCKSVAFDSVQPAWKSLNALLEKIEYRGIFSAEFKRDVRDGGFKVIEINTRPWVYIQFAEKCGINMCELYIQDAVQENVINCPDYDVDRFCVNLFADYRALRGMPSGTRPSVLSVLSTWFRSFKVLFDWYDMRPAIKSVFGVLTARANRYFSAYRPRASWRRQ